MSLKHKEDITEVPEDSRAELSSREQGKDAGLAWARVPTYGQGLAWFESPASVKSKHSGFLISLNVGHKRKKKKEVMRF